MAHGHGQHIDLDDDLDIFERANIWFTENWKQVAIFAVIVLVVLGGTSIYRKMRADKYSAASAELGGVMQNLRGALTSTDAAKRKEQFQTAIDRAERLVSNYSGTYAARAAQLAMGNAWYYQAAGSETRGQESRDNLKSAVDAYQKYLTMAETDEEKAEGQLALAQAQENLMFASGGGEESQNYQKQALDAYKEAQRLGNGTYIDAEAKLGQARLLYGLQRRENDARTLLEAVAAERKLPEPSDKKERPIKDENGNEITPKQAHLLRIFADDSYKKVAEDNLALMPAPSGKR